MPEEFQGTVLRRFFDVLPDGSAVIAAGDVTITFTGLAPVPAGSRYFIVLDGTPTMVPREPQES